MHEIATPEADTEALEPAQARALAALAQGKSRADAANEAGVCRTTVWRWINSDPVFSALWNQVRQDQADDLRGELRGLASEAVAATREILTNKDTPPETRLKAAALVFKVASPEPPQKIGCTDPNDAAHVLLTTLGRL